MTTPPLPMINQRSDRMLTAKYRSCKMIKVILAASLVVLLLSISGSLSFSRLKSGASKTFEKHSENEIITVPLGRGIVHSSIRVPPGAPEDRRDRFPSFSQRLKMHTGYWYLPPCNATKDVAFYRRSTDEGNHTRLDIQTGAMNASFSTESLIVQKLLWFDMDNILEIGERERKTLGSTEFVDDTLELVVPWWKELNEVEKKNPPMLMQYGDHRDVTTPFGKSGACPVIGKVRRTISPSELNLMTEGNCTRETMGAYSNRAVIHFLTVKRHLQDVFKLEKLDVVPWEEKKPQAVFRAATSGFMFSNVTEGEKLLQEVLLSTTGNATTDLGEDYEFALELVRKLRFQFCWRYRSSPLFNLGYISWSKQEKEVLSRMQLLRDPMELSDMLKYKAIVVIEGNDVATSLKWVLYSYSVPLMAKPTVVSFALEEFLEPWVHYVPLKDDLTDAEEKMQWVLDHDEEARIIAERGRLYIHDLLFHPDAEDENRRLEMEILRRVRAHYRPML